MDVGGLQRSTHSQGTQPTAVQAKSQNKEDATISSLGKPIFDSLNNIGNVSDGKQLKISGVLIQNKDINEGGRDSFNVKNIEGFSTMMREFIQDSSTTLSDLRLIRDKIPEALNGLTTLQENYKIQAENSYFSWVSAQNTYENEIQILTEGLKDMATLLDKKIGDAENLRNGHSMDTIVDNNRFQGKSLADIEIQIKKLGLLENSYLDAAPESSYSELCKTLNEIPSNLLSKDEKYEILAKCIKMEKPKGPDGTEDKVKFKADLATLSSALNRAKDAPAAYDESKKETIQSTVKEQVTDKIKLEVKIKPKDDADDDSWEEEYTMVKKEGPTVAYTIDPTTTENIVETLINVKDGIVYGYEGGVALAGATYKAAEAIYTHGKPVVETAGTVASVVFGGVVTTARALQTGAHMVSGAYGAAKTILQQETNPQTTEEYKKLLSQISDPNVSSTEVGNTCNGWNRNRYELVIRALKDNAINLTKLSESTNLAQEKLEYLKRILST
jgi:hypothetical protein